MSQAPNQSMTGRRGAVSGLLLTRIASSRTLFGNMRNTSAFSYPAGPDSPATDPQRRTSVGGSLVFAIAVLLGCGLTGVAGGLAWGHLAPRVTYVVISRGSADVVNPETTAFIAGDAWYCLIALAGGAVIGVTGYLLAVRKYGPLPMVAVLAGSVASGLLARGVGQDQGLSRFNDQLASSRPGVLLHAPPVLGGDPSTILWPAIVFWPLAACLAAGGLVAVAVLRARQGSYASHLIAAPYLEDR